MAPAEQHSLLDLVAGCLVGGAIGDGMGSAVEGRSTVSTEDLQADWRLRHTFASHIVMRGKPVQAVKELLGHSSIATTMRYAHLSPDVLRDTVAALDEPAPRPHDDHMTGAKVLSMDERRQTIKKPGTS